MTNTNERRERLKRWRTAQMKDKKLVGYKERIDLLNSGMTALTRFAFFVGFLALASYLGAAQHLVTGINLTDAFLLAALALALGFLGVLIAIVGVFMVGAQVNFLVAYMAADTTTEKLSCWKKLAVCGFILFAVIYTFAVPFLYMQMPKVPNWVIQLTLFLNFCASAALAWYWDFVQKLCEAPGQRRKKSRDRLDRFGEGFVTATVLFMSSMITLILLAVLEPRVLVVFFLIGFLGAAGLCLTFVQGRRVTESWASAGRKVMAVTLVTSIFLVFLLPAFNGKTGVTKAFQMVSLNVPDATIDVSAENLVRLERAAHQQGLPLEICRHADGSATLTNIQVLWHTLGDTGLVELWSESYDHRPYGQSLPQRFQPSPVEIIFNVLGATGLRVPLKNSGLQVRTGSNLHCLELNGLHFDSNSAALSEDAKKDLSQQLVALRDALAVNKAVDETVVEQAARFEVVGHADPRKRQNGTNEELADKRAAAVRELLEAWIKDNAPQWSKATVKSRSEGAREQARKCDTMTGAESEACNAFNRRVVVQLSTLR